MTEVEEQDFVPTEEFTTEEVEGLLLTVCELSEKNREHLASITVSEEENEAAFFSAYLFAMTGGVEAELQALSDIETDPWVCEE